MAQAPLTTEAKHAERALLERALSVIGTLALVGLLVVPIWLAIEATNQRHHVERPAEQEHRASFSLTVSGENGSYEVSGEASDKEDERWLWFRSPESGLAWLTLFLVAGTGVLAFYTARLWSSTKDAFEDARKSHERELRAYVSVRSVVPHPVALARGAEFHFQVTLINSGKTPTRNARSYITTISFESEPGLLDMPEDFPFYDVYPNYPVRRSAVHIGPNQTSLMQATFREEVIAAVGTGRRFALFYGWIEYDDVFKGSPRHRTEFCWVVTATPLADGSFDIACRRSQYYNGADEDCRFQPRANMGLPELF